MLYQEYKDRIIEFSVVSFESKRVNMSNLQLWQIIEIAHFTIKIKEKEKIKTESHC